MLHAYQRVPALVAGLAIALHALPQCGAGEVEVQIEVTTDGYGYETYWELLPSGSSCGSGTLFAGGNPAVGCNGAGAQAQLPGGYGNNITVVEGPWCLTEGGAYTIFWADDWGDGGLSFNVIVDGVSSAQFAGGLGSPAETYPFLAQVPADHDIAILRMHTPLYVFDTEPLLLSGELRNNGALPVTSVELSYTIDGGAPVTGTLTGLNLAPGVTMRFEHPVEWTATGTGMHAVSITPSLVNGNPDGNSANDLATFGVKVLAPVPNIIDQYVQVAPQVTVIADSDQDLLVPRDLDFHPDLERNELWVINKDVASTGGSTVTFFQAGEPDMSFMWRRDPNAWHFMSLPTGIAMGDNGFFATCPGIFDANQNGGDPFTGPSLWSADTAIYADVIYGPLGSHFDMLHVTPNSQGIAHERWNRYWVVDGFNGDIVMNDFAQDHGPGNSWHGDAIIRRYSDFAITKDPADHIVSHTALDKATGMLYVVDHGGQRVLALDTRSGSVVGQATYGPWETYVEYSQMTGYDWAEIVSSGLVEPAGIDVLGDRLLVSDHATGDIVIYDLTVNPVAELGRIVTGSPGIMGIRIGPDGRVWAVNATTHQLLRMDPQTVTAVQANAAPQARVSPVPTADQLMVTGSGIRPGTVLAVLDMAGRCLRDIVFPGDGRPMDVAGLADGTYLLRSGVEMPHLRFVIQR